MGLIDDIKRDIKKSGTNKGKMLFFKSDTKRRVRFLQEIDTGMKILFHDSFEKGINVPCQIQFGKDCPYCEDDSLRSRYLYLWQTYDYESKEIKLLLAAVNNCSPVPQLVSHSETYGDCITDRDYVITKTGSQTSSSFAVSPMDKVRFKIKVKLLSEAKVNEIVDKAFPSDIEDEDDEKPKNKKSKNEKAKSKPVKEIEYDDDDEEDEELDYEDMTAKELYSLCVKRDIKCKPKKDEEYYINLLEEDDEENEDGDDDEW